jgi:hypothetical protein
MNTPNIKYYARFEESTKAGASVPKYTITAQAGYYPAMDQLKGREGQISMYLTEKLKEGDRVPSMRLQAKNSLNFTGLKEYFINGKLSGYAYGYPDDRKTYSKKNLPNPFYECKEDSYLFFVHQNEKEPGSPTSIELIVIEGGKVLIAAYCKQLQMGGFNDILQALREQAAKSV